jgi:Cdc6-like AAA superfamily ATPase
VINFVCKKIAKCSSDIRKCFQILREAILLHTKSNYDSQNFKIKSDTVTKAYDAVYRDHFTDIYSSMPKNFKIILSFLAEYAKNGTRLMSIETACSILKSKYHFHEGNAKEFLIALMGMGVVEIKHTISETSKTRYLKEFNVRLAIDI